MSSKISAGPAAISRPALTTRGASSWLVMPPSNQQIAETALPSGARPPPGPRRGRCAQLRQAAGQPGSAGRASLSEASALPAAAFWPGGFPDRSCGSRSVAAVWRVGGQPLCRECVGRRLARAVAGDSGEEVLPAQGEGMQWLLGGDGRCPRDVAKQRDLAEAISAVQGWPGRALHADRRRPVDDEGEVVAGLSLAHDHRAGGELAR